MSKAARSAAPPSAPGEEPPVEEAVQKLEAIVQTMESGGLPLVTCLARVGEGRVPWGVDGGGVGEVPASGNVGCYGY